MVSKRMFAGTLDVLQAANKVKISGGKRFNAIRYMEYFGYIYRQRRGYCKQIRQIGQTHIPI